MPKNKSVNVGGSSIFIKITPKMPMLIQSLLYLTKSLNEFRIKCQVILTKSSKIKQPLPKLLTQRFARLLLDDLNIQVVSTSAHLI